MQLNQFLADLNISLTLISTISLSILVAISPVLFIICGVDVA